MAVTIGGTAPADFFIFLFVLGSFLLLLQGFVSRARAGRWPKGLFFPISTVQLCCGVLWVVLRWGFLAVSGLFDLRLPGQIYFVYGVGGGVSLFCQGIGGFDFSDWDWRGGLAA